MTYLSQAPSPLIFPCGYCFLFTSISLDENANMHGFVGYNKTSKKCGTPPPQTHSLGRASEGWQLLSPLFPPRLEAHMALQVQILPQMINPLILVGFGTLGSWSLSSLGLNCPMWGGASEEAPRCRRSSTPHVLPAQPCQALF